jgi:hypothetical protein
VSAGSQVRLFGDGRKLGQVLGMDGSGFGAGVRGGAGAGWEAVADEAISVCLLTRCLFPFIPIPIIQ